MYETMTRAVQPTETIYTELQNEEPALISEERCLTEVDQLLNHRQLDGTYSQWVKDELLKNLVTATAEAAMPYAVTKTRHVYRSPGEYDGNWFHGSYMWLGMTAVENAMSGRRFHRHAAAKERVEVEIDEAKDTEANLRPGFTKVFISPRMSRTDATHEVAKAEHLADDDSVRVSNAIIDELGNIKEREMQSLLVRDIPLEAWVSMMKDSNNIFGKAIYVENPESALSVMKTHRELEVPEHILPEGVVSIIETVIPYIKDADIKANVEQQLKRFRSDQVQILEESISVAKRWQDFEIELANSLHDEKATLSMESFINSMQSRWNKDDLAIIHKHQIAGSAQYIMTRELAVIVEKAKQRLLLVPAAVVTGNEEVLAQMDEADADRIRRGEKLLRVLSESGYDYAEIRVLEMQNHQLAANFKGKMGGGCPGEIDAEFDNYNSLGGGDSKISGSENRTGKEGKGKCVVDVCPTRPKEVRVGGCGVCLDRCQKIYDKGQDPTRMHTTIKKAQTMKADTHEFSLTT